MGKRSQQPLEHKTYNTRRADQNERTLHVDERGRVGHGKGLVSGGKGLSLMDAGHDHLNGLALVIRNPL